VQASGHDAGSLGSWRVGNRADGRPAPKPNVGTTVHTSAAWSVASYPSTLTSRGTLRAYADLHGNITATANDAGAQVGSRVAYDPWGQALTNPADPANVNVTGSFSSYGAKGKVTDPGSGVTIMGARPYLPAQARFATVDPVEGGCSNAYAYSFGDPFGKPDLSGQHSCSGVPDGCLALSGPLEECNARNISPHETVTLAVVGVVIGVTGGIVAVVAVPAGLETVAVAEGAEAASIRAEIFTHYGIWIGGRVTAGGIIVYSVGQAAPMAEQGCAPPPVEEEV
jgi:RHS repeat-associated protein